MLGPRKNSCWETKRKSKVMHSYI